VLYTDGLVERRGSTLDAGMARLVAAVHDVAGLPLDEVCDGLLARMLDGRPEDDVALVAVRVPPFPP
jgi:serine phosphatase RsbU (regulator of sigma subunit)